MTSSAALRSGRGFLSRLRAALSFRAAQRKSSSPYALLTDNYAFHSFVHTPGKPVWTPRQFSKFADEAYIKNVIAHRAIGMIAQGAASAPWKLHATSAGGQKREVKKHPLLALLH